MAPPDFTSTDVFPSFASLPSALSSPAERPAHEWFLIAQVKDDMTITKPTLVLTDRDNAPFALVWDGLERGDLDLKKKGLKKGTTAVLSRALRTPPKEETKRGFVSIEKARSGDVKAIPGPIDKVLQLGEKLRAKEASDGEEKCESCGNTSGQEGKALSKCTACGEVRYCSKECQIKGWNDGGHKTECKIYKGLNAIWS
ncbi:hypothetical protein GQ53DRAFT_821982 [Thozetella sp. PMI_491]|nr:hypothetical protein GQ53DRAFT_821982 [Thozetella sp. PMI_491]